MKIFVGFDRECNVFDNFNVLEETIKKNPKRKFIIIFYIKNIFSYIIIINLFRKECEWL